MRDSFLVLEGKRSSWADGFLVDAEFKGDDAEFVKFLKVFGEALHGAGKYLGVFL
jgi:hypothetical protein